MTEETMPKASTAASDASQTRQRKKRKWDQPADSLVSAGVVVPGVLPVENMGFLGGVSLPVASPASAAILMNPLLASSIAKPPVFQAPLIQPQPATVGTKLKIQDELIIAREIVINDAESSVRYKLTKRQTQEEIQKCTGAVVITRGKYHPPNSPPDGEKPLYLHISAGAHLKEIAEQIIAVDRAAIMVEEMLKSQNLQVTQLLSTCLFLGFDANPSLNIASRIRGPNDQYINHIMNETGATVLLRGYGSGNFESARGDGQQPLHLFLSSNNPKSLEDAKCLAENLLDTISVECGASRVSSAKVYGAVPPLQQLAGAHTHGNDTKTSTCSGIILTSSTVGSPAPSVAVPSVTTVFSQATVPQPGGLSNCPPPQQNVGGYPQPSLPGGTSYSGHYGGIYPQATPLQQVALALRQSSSPTMPMVAPTTPVTLAEPKLSASSNADKEKRPSQKRKFQELPVGSKSLINLHQEPPPVHTSLVQGEEVLPPLEFRFYFTHINGRYPPSPLMHTPTHLNMDTQQRGKSSQHTEVGVRNISTMPAPRKLAQLSPNGMPLLPPRAMPPPPPAEAMPPPPPPPKFSSSIAERVHVKTNIQNKTISETVPDTLVKLMEYGEEDDDDDEEEEEESHGSNSSTVTTQKPFWAL